MKQLHIRSRSRIQKCDSDSQVCCESDSDSTQKLPTPYGSAPQPCQKPTRKYRSLTKCKVLFRLDSVFSPLTPLRQAPKRGGFLSQERYFKGRDSNLGGSWPKLPPLDSPLNYCQSKNIKQESLPLLNCWSVFNNKFKTNDFELFVCIDWHGAWPPAPLSAYTLL